MTNNIEVTFKQQDYNDQFITIEINIKYLELLIFDKYQLEYKFVNNINIDNTFTYETNKDVDEFTITQLNNIFIRSLESYRLYNCVRISIGLKNENKTLINVTKKFLKEKKNASL